MNRPKLACGMCQENADQLILYDGLLFCSRQCIRDYDHADPPIKFTAHFYENEVRYCGEDGFDFDFALIDGSVPPVPQPGEVWEIAMRKVGDER